MNRGLLYSGEWPCCWRAVEIVRLHTSESIGQRTHGCMVLMAAVMAFNHEEDEHDPQAKCRHSINLGGRIYMRDLFSSGVFRF